MIEEDQAILQAYKAFKNGYDGDIPFNLYYNYILDWTIHPIKYRDKVVGAIFTKDNKIHISVNGPWFPRKYVKPILYPLFEVYNELETTVDDYNVSGLNWVKKFGFRVIEKTTDKTRLVLTKDDIWVS